MDVGCGDGVWLEGFRDCGVDIFGLDGEWAREHLRISDQDFRATDLAQPFKLDRDFDLAVSLEVAEHLPSDSAEGFVDSLTTAAPAILFSAAIPNQKGTHHINLQWPQYWAELFALHRFVAIDCVRSRGWSDKRVSGPYAQNAMIFVERDHLERLPALKREAADGFPSPPPLVHPDIFLTAVGAANRRQQRARNRADRGAARDLDKTRLDLRNSEARRRSLERRVSRLERRLYRLRSDRWFRFGQLLRAASARLTQELTSRWSK